ncbi:hypothetical protein I5M32_10535 [Pedobacter sp. SD-b]|uniref:DUF4468 domain-containing protein n=1 Tax=Pedobacter segetis TaxID=2793069 RepID=A0ABS1BKI1_9SPHI|nr:hypothetical protein [Pedobacter segetis]MBK0383398.1 hypothetical protein [Pedobacter segetis]
MKNLTIVLFLLILSKAGVASNFYRLEDDSTKKISLENHEIKYKDKLLGNYTTKAIKLEGNKITKFIVRFFETGGNEIAEYHIEVINKVKRNQVSIIEASLSTLSDHVTHNGSNFIDFNQRSITENESAVVPQLKNTIAYLIKNKYLL